MRWSLRIARLAGIGVYVHWTFLLLIAWLVFVFASQGQGPIQIVQGVLFVMAIFACVVLHEFGHAMAGRTVGVRTRDITLLPIGGLARLERMPERPLEELWVAIAGPMVNVAIAAALLVLLLALGQPILGEDLLKQGGGFLPRLMWVNVVLVVFNMIPAFPMDGGRVLRALLATSMDRALATRIAASVGQLIAIGFGLLGLFFNPLLLLIAIFVYLGAAYEARDASTRAAVRGLRAADAMQTRFRALSPADTIQDAVEELLAGAQADFPVVDQSGAPVGILSRDAIVRALHQGQANAPVGEHMAGPCPSASEADALDALLPRMRDGNCAALAVVRDGRIVGLVTSENISELMMVRSAVRDGRGDEELDDLIDRG